MFRFAFLTMAVFISIQATHARRWHVPKDNKVMVEIRNDRKNFSSSLKLNPNDIGIFVWNMYKGKKSAWESDFKELASRYDLLLLQEVWLDKKMKRVFEEDDFSYHIATSFMDKKRGYIRTGVGTASRIDPIKTFFQRSHYREPIIRTPKMILFSEYELEGRKQTLLAGNIHALNFVSSRKLRHQLGVAAQVLKNHDGPVVMAGDFNTWSKKKQRYLKEFARKTGLKEVKFHNGHERMKTFKNYLDYIFVRQAKVLDSHVFGKREGSDHRAMSVKISIN